MKRELAWMPGYAGKNHLYDLATNKAICGSDAKPKTDKRGWGLNYWQNMDCPRCKSKANELEEKERTMNSDTAYQCSDCGKIMAQDMSHRCVSTGGANPAEMKPGTCMLSDIEPGSAFMAADGTMALKSEYQLRPDDPASPAMCIIFGSGEYFHGEAPGVHGNDVQVWPIYIPIASNSWRDKYINSLRHALQEIVTRSFSWDDNVPGNFDLERQRWHKLRNIAMAGLQTIEV